MTKFQNSVVNGQRSVVNGQGFTLIELLVVIAVISVLYAVSLYFLRPEILKARARDAVRLSDLSKLQAVIENYLSDNGLPPGTNNLLRESSSPVSPGADPAEADADGWLGVDLTARTDKLPVDPVNSGVNVYRYKRVNGDYELDVKLEYYLSLMENGQDGDGGDSDLWLEKGTDLTLLGD